MEQLKQFLILTKQFSNREFILQFKINFIFVKLLTAVFKLFESVRTQK